jgi:hypothetical protein
MVTAGRGVDAPAGVDVGDRSWRSFVLVLGRSSARRPLPLLPCDVLDPTGVDPSVAEPGRAPRGCNRWDRVRSDHGSRTLVLQGRRLMPPNLSQHAYLIIKANCLKID